MIRIDRTYRVKNIKGMKIACCPHCGGEAVLEVNSNKYDDRQMYSFTVKCACGATMLATVDKFPDYGTPNEFREEALAFVRAWNKRIPANYPLTEEELDHQLQPYK